MEWHTHETSYCTAARLDPSVRRMERKEFYDAVRHLRSTDLEGIEWRYQAAAERLWELKGRPFYNVWPSVVEGLSRLRLTIPCGAVLPALDHIPEAVCLRFARGHEFRVGDAKLLSILACRITVPKERIGTEYDEPGLCLLCDAGERTDRDVRVYWTIRFGFRDCTVEESIAKIDQRLQPDEAAVTHAAVRIFLSVCLMHRDPEMVDSVVLKADEKEWQKTKNRDLVQRARERGVRGWNVRARLQVSPHYRCAHFALRWTGVGRAVPRVVPVRGTIVRRHRITEVPTGHEPPVDATPNASNS